MVGIDIIEIDRIARAILRPNFIKNVFTAAELDYYQKKGSAAETLAGFFCAKEAIAKASGVGLRGFKMTDIEILHTLGGQPYAKLYNAAAQLFVGQNLHISISHNQTSATAVCMALPAEKAPEKSDTLSLLLSNPAAAPKNLDTAIESLLGGTDTVLEQELGDLRAQMLMDQLDTLLQEEELTRSLTELRSLEKED